MTDPLWALELAAAEHRSPAVRCEAATAWLARHGFAVTPASIAEVAVDVSPGVILAVWTEHARSRAAAIHVQACGLRGAADVAGLYGCEPVRRGRRR